MATAGSLNTPADGGLIDYTTILPKRWQTALGADEGVQIWGSSRDQKRPKYTVWVTIGPQTEVAPTYFRVWDWVWEAVGGMADAPLPLPAWGGGCRAPECAHTSD